MLILKQIKSAREMEEFLQKNCLVNKPPDVLKQGRRKVFRTETSVLEDFGPPSTFLPKETHRLSTTCKIMPSHKARNYS